LSCPPFASSTQRESARQFSAAASPDITRLLLDWGDGDLNALNEVIELVYADLRRTARAFLRGDSAERTLQPTALVHEVYGRLMMGKSPRFASRTHFFRCARLIMRQVLVGYARMRVAAKRGSGEEPLPFQEDAVCFGGRRLELATILSLEQALAELRELEPNWGQVIELRFFLGLNERETAEVLGLSERTVRRRWSAAQRWLARKLTRDA